MTNLYKIISLFAQIAQLVEQRTENPCVGGSIPPLGTTKPFKINVSSHLKTFGIGVNS